eukprot:3440734-Lingulodinium_polyedra.AAC.1
MMVGPEHKDFFAYNNLDNVRMQVQRALEAPLVLTPTTNLFHKDAHVDPVCYQCVGALIHNDAMHFVDAAKSQAKGTLVLTRTWRRAAERSKFDLSGKETTRRLKRQADAIEERMDRLAAQGDKVEAASAQRLHDALCSYEFTCGVDWVNASAP